MDYSGLQSYLKTEQRARTPFVAPVYNEIVNDKAVFEKTVTEGAGTFFLQNAGMSTVKSALKKMNIFSSEESDELLTSLGKGEGKEALQKLAKKLAKKGFKKLSKKISDQADKFKSKGEGTEPEPETEGDDAANQAGNDVETAAKASLKEGEVATTAAEEGEAGAAEAATASDDLVTRASSLSDKLTNLTNKIKSASTEADDVKPPAPPKEDTPSGESEESGPADEPKPPVGDDDASADDDLLSAGKKAVAKGLKGLTGIGDDAEEAGSVIGKGLKTAGEIEALGGGPEDPISDVISAIVGLGSLIFGGLRKTHKDSFVTPPLPPQTFESSNIQKVG